MISNYIATVNYWDNVFGEEALTVSKPFPFPEIEDSLKWVCHESRHIVDFGCGNGKVLLRCLSLGIEEGLGIDISTKAISLATRTAQNNGLAGRATFVTGSTSRLEALGDSSVDAMILFNIVDNLIPSDARALIEEVTRITRPEGRILLALQRKLMFFEKLSNTFSSM